MTRRQAQVYQYLLERHSSGAAAPTLSEICAALGLRSRGSLHKHIRALVAAGLVSSPAGQRRGIHLQRPAPRDDNLVPFWGYIAAGRPIEAVPQDECISVPTKLCGKGRCYCLRVRGDSMVEDGILDGDWVIVCLLYTSPSPRDRG